MRRLTVPGTLAFVSLVAAGCDRTPPTDPRSSLALRVEADQASAPKNFVAHLSGANEVPAREMDDDIGAREGTPGRLVGNVSLGAIHFMNVVAGLAQARHESLADEAGSAGDEHASHPGIVTSCR